MAEQHFCKVKVGGSTPLSGSTTQQTSTDVCCVVEQFYDSASKIPD